LNTLPHLRNTRLAGLAAGALLLAGCATYDPGPPLVLTGDPVIDTRARLERAPPRDRVLWQYQLAAEQVRAGQADAARATLDDALALASGVLTADAGTRRARSLFGAESEKTFIGEPYERVMAWFYRGLLYWRDGEPDNARAAFRTGQVLDTDPENQRAASDYVLLELLDAQATAQLGGDGSSHLARARELAGTARPVEVNSSATVLFFAEFGRAPQKYAAGNYGEQLRFRAGPSRLQAARLTVAGRTIPLPALDDLAFQASTRGGRVMDHILGNKVVFREAASSVGQAAIIAGAAILERDADKRRRGEGGSEGRENLGVGLIAAGVFAEILSAATQTRADTRAWSNLPQYLAYVPLELPPGDHPAVLEFLDAKGKPVPAHTQNFTIQAGQPGRPTVLLRSALH
jgi:hypothetical protein